MDERFVTLMRSHYGRDMADALVDTLFQGEASTSVRVNPWHRLPPRGTPVPWCPQGYYLDERPAFISDPLLHAGAYYVQEAASMFVWHALTQLPLPPSPLVLDLCAAPGGKSTLALSCLPDEALLVCNEAIRSRTGALVENICKWGRANVVVTGAEAETFRGVGEAFDVVLADVPCSGEGMFRKSKEAVNQWNMDKVRRCQALQRKIVGEAWACLRPGGYLVYSTCTFNPLEDEQNVDWILNELGGESIDLQPNPSWALVAARHTDAFGYHFLPHLTRGEGFFLSVVLKPGTARAPRALPRLAQARPLAPLRTGRHKGRSGDAAPAPAQAAGGLPVVVPEDHTLLSDPKGQLSAFPRAHVPFLDVLSHAGIRPLQVGTPLAAEKGKGRWRPLQPLAHSPLLNPAAIPCVPLSRAEALSYLRGQALTLPPTTPRGFLLATFAGHPLGFLNQVDGHANNLYPVPWRIQKVL